MIGLRAKGHRTGMTRFEFDAFLPRNVHVSQE